MRADRLLAILLLLQEHGRLSARRLAERLEVSERTVHRDMEALAMAGVPVWAQTGRHGGWELAEGYRTDLTGLSEGELRSLVLAGASSHLRHLGVGEDLDRAVTKVLASLPETRRAAARSAGSYLYVDPAGWRRSDDAVPWLPALDEALRRARRVRIRYERTGDQATVDRTVDPLGLVVQGSTWYLLAGVDGGTRTYRVSRLRDVVLLDEPADRPADLDLAATWQAGREAFRRALPQATWTMRVSPQAIGRVRFGWRFASVVEELPADEDGWVTVRCRADGLPVAIECTLGLGPDVVALEPPELVEAVVDRARAVVERAAARPVRPATS
jgi:predicted DNA-binding transcriptional regulator YafY